MKITPTIGFNTQQNNNRNYQSKPNFGHFQEVELTEKKMLDAKYNPEIQRILQSANLTEVNEKLNEIASSIVSVIKKSFYRNSDVNMLGDYKNLQFIKNNNKGEQVLATMKTVPATHNKNGIITYKDYEVHQTISLELKDGVLTFVRPEFQ